MDAYTTVLDTRPPIVILQSDAPPVPGQWTSRFINVAVFQKTLNWPDLLSDGITNVAVKSTSASVQARDGSESLPPSFVITNHPAQAGLQRLRTFRGWKDNWDAEGSKGPELDVLNFADQVFSLLAIHNVPEVTLTAEGHPMFVYGAPVKGEVIVTGNKTISYFFLENDAPEGEDVLIGSFLPDDLIATIRPID